MEWDEIPSMMRVVSVDVISAQQFSFSSKLSSNLHVTHHFVGVSCTAPRYYLE